MPYLLIITGLLFIAVGIYLLSRRSAPPIKSKEGSERMAASTERPSSAERNRQKGQAFEEFIINTLTARPGTTLVGRNSDYHKNGISAEENRQPDLRFRKNGEVFAVECKWRSRWEGDRIEWAKDYQIANYQHYAREQRQEVFVALGIGGEPSAPAEWYLVPLYRLTKGFATQDYVRENRQP